MKLNFSTVQSTELEVLGTLSEAIESSKEWRLSKAGRSVLLFNAKGEMATINFSKPVTAALEAGELQYDQIGHLQVINGTNAANEERMYATFPGNVGGVANLSSKKAVAAFAKADPIERTATAKLPDALAAFVL